MGVSEALGGEVDMERGVGRSRNLSEEGGLHRGITGGLNIFFRHQMLGTERVFQ